jgi:hypothetical protein
MVLLIFQMFRRQLSALLLLGTVGRCANRLNIAKHGIQLGAIIAHHGCMPIQNHLRQLLGFDIIGFILKSALLNTLSEQNHSNIIKSFA